MSGIVAEAKVELERLRKEQADLSSRIKLVNDRIAAVANVLASYGVSTSAQGGLQPPSQSLFSSRFTNESGFGSHAVRGGGKVATVADAVERVLENRGGGPVPLLVILEDLQKMGVAVGGANPRNTLSASMSHSKRFVSEGRIGWRKRRPDEPLKQTEPSGGPTPEGSLLSVDGGPV